MKIALATVGTAGDVLPFRALARRLASGGHEVTAVTWPVHQRLLDLPGVRLELAGSHADLSRIATVADEAARQGPMDQVATLRDFHLADGAAHQRYWADRLRTLGVAPDPVVLGEGAGARLASAVTAAAIDPRLRTAAASLADRLRSEDGLSTAVALLERSAAP